jgi:hypothetical protein
LCCLSYFFCWPKEVGQTTQWSKEVGQTTQWPKEVGQTTQWPKEVGQTTQWPKEVGQTTQWPKEKDNRTNHDLQNITQKTKDGVILISLKTGMNAGVPEGLLMLP